VLASIGAIGISRSIVRPLREVVGVANAVSQGNLDGRITCNDGSEIGDLARAMRGMVTTLGQFATAQTQLEQQHEAGNIDFQMEAARFPGAYGRMAEGINSVVAAHVQVKMNAIRIVAQYARGDLAEDIERYPGQKA